MERVAWLKLRAVHVLIASMNASIQELRQATLALRHASVEQLRTGLESQDLHLDSAAALEFEERQMRQRLHRLETERRIAENKFLQARCDREIVGNAIKLQRDAYDAEKSRREQSLTDDLTLQRRVRNHEEARPGN